MAASIWNKALKDEDCVRVRELLTSTSGEFCAGRGAVELLKEGWFEEVPASIWKGRTALHVAARRGDVQLVKDILKVSYRLRRNRQGSTELNHDLLKVINTDYELDALGMAIANGNKQIANLLQRASLNCAGNPYEIRPVAIACDGGVSDEGKQALLSNVIKEVLSTISQSPTENGVKNDVNIRNIKQMYKEDCDFNFIQLYNEDCEFNFNQSDADIELDMHLFFHFIFSTWTMVDEGMVDLMWEIPKQILSRAKEDDELLEYLLVKLKDGQGRTALHVAVDSQKVGAFLGAIKPLGEGDKTKKYFETKKYLNVADSANRTPLYRAAAKKHFWALKDLLEDERTDIHATIEYDAYDWGTGLDIDKLSWKNGFRSDCVYIPLEKLIRKGFNNKDRAGPGPDINPVEKNFSTALHVAIIHKHEGIVKQIIEKIFERLEVLLANHGHFEHCKPDCKDDHFAENSPNCSRRCTWPILTALQGDEKAWANQISEVNTMQLTVLVGSIPILQRLLKAEKKSKKPGYFSDFGTESHCPNFLLAAAMGNPEVIKAFLESNKGKFDYNVRDSFNNTALHHALKGKHVPFRPHIVDFVGCHHVYSSRWNNDVALSQWLANPQENPRIRDVENDNKADLEGRYNQRRGSINLLLEAGIDMWTQNVHRRTASPDPDAPKDFVEWWYEKAATLTKEEQRKQNDAANAISVVAALVATASYLGPLQPPLGYNENSLQVNVLAVRIFVVCNSLSFYFALAAIMCALLPSLPLQNESLFRELDRTRNFVAFAVTCLFPSIIFVLVAFAAGYIAVIPDHGLSHHGLIMATTVVGGFVCLYVMIWFIGRLLKVLKNRLNGSLLGLVLKSLEQRLKWRLGGTCVVRWLKQMNDVMEKIRTFAGVFVRRIFDIEPEL